MRRAGSIGLLALIGCLALAAGSAAVSPAAWPHPEELTYPPVTITPREAERHELDNGLVVYLMADRELPLVHGAAYIQAGSVYDPPDRIGLAGMTANLLRTGGANGRHPDELDVQLEVLAASVEVSASDIYAGASFSALSDNVFEVLAVLDDVLRRPDFLPERIELLRARQLEAIRRRNDRPVNIAISEFFQRVAEGHPLGYFPTRETVTRITADDLADFHARYYQPQAVVMAITGDFDQAEMLAYLEQTLGTWEAADVDYPELPAFNRYPAPRIYHAQRPLEQSIILIGHPAVTFDSRAFAPLNVANRILGGAGDNRLFREIRSLRGLAYSVGSQLTQGLGYPGFFFAYSISRVDRTMDVIELMLKEIRRMTEEPVSGEEFAYNQEAILNRAVYRYSSPGAIAGQQALVEFLDLDPDYYERYIARVQELDPETLLDYARTELRPDDAIIMVVGDEARFDRPLSGLGDVVPVELDQ